MPQTEKFLQTLIIFFRKIKHDNLKNQKINPLLPHVS